MLCDNCKKNEATVHIKKLTNGSEQEYSLCNGCANQLNEMNFVDISSLELTNTFTVQDLIGSIIDYVNQSTHSSDVDIKTCKNCKMSYAEFKKTGLMGCSECYETFKTSLIPVIKGVQGNIEHVGKIPKRSGKEIMGKRHLLNLRENLNKAITSEEYERAAEIRDEIRAIQSVNKEV